jgi:hypothetical protein
MSKACIYLIALSLPQLGSTATILSLRSGSSMRVAVQGYRFAQT